MSNRILSVGAKFPSFNKKAVVSIEAGKEFFDLNSNQIFHAGKWTVMFWWPSDFSFICPTEVIEFSKHFIDFSSRDTTLIGASTDSEFVHLAWRKSNPELNNISLAMLADTSKSLAEELGILEQEEKIAYRTTFIIDPQGIIRWVSVYDMNVGRNVNEIIRVLDALRTDERCPYGWQKGDKTLTSLT
jgi:alkyl hydroperoxide reductase subunit AhpC